MKVRMTLTFEAHRDRRRQDAAQEQEAAPPMVDVKGSASVERSRQGEPNDLRAGLAEHWYRIGFQPNEEPR